MTQYFAFRTNFISIETSLTKETQFELSEIISPLGLTFLVDDWRNGMLICWMLFLNFNKQLIEGVTCLPRFWKIILCYRLRHPIINNCYSAHNCFSYYFIIYNLRIRWRILLNKWRFCRTSWTNVCFAYGIKFYSRLYSCAILAVWIRRMSFGIGIFPLIRKLFHLLS